ncbi:MAG: hypothetical protein HC910_18920 [Spirulinaceae cyanobacterium SM2_1_0]|nr:hypothetical protein [Spirulinaceae cyanobacterium SM2_1_0]
MSDFESLKSDLVALSAAERQQVFDLVNPLKQRQPQHHLSKNQRDFRFIETLVLLPYP